MPCPSLSWDRKGLGLPAAEGSPWEVMEQEAAPTRGWRRAGTPPPPYLVNPGRLPQAVSLPAPCLPFTSPKILVAQTQCLGDPSLPGLGHRSPRLSSPNQRKEEGLPGSEGPDWSWEESGTGTTAHPPGLC